MKRLCATIVHLLFSVAVFALSIAPVLFLSLPAVAQEGPGIITTFAGKGTRGYSGDGGPAAQASLSGPAGVAVDASGNVYIADMSNHRIRRVGTDGIITTFAGTGAAGYSGDGGPAAQARLNSPTGVAVDASGNVYIANTGNARIRRVGTDGAMTTVAGTGLHGFSGDGGPAAQARLSGPNGVTVDAKGVVYIADTGNHRIRRVGPDGIITTVAGTGTSGFSGDGGPAAQARLNGPRSVAVASTGSVYIADDNNCVRRVGIDGVITTVAGTGTFGFSGDGGPAAQARLSGPKSVAVDAQGNIYIADASNNRIRRVSPAAVVSEPSIRLSVSSLIFDPVSVGVTAQQTFTVSNTGGGSLSVTGITVRGTEEFSVSPATATIAAGQSQTVTVKFAPTSAGEKSATLSIAHNAPGSPSSIALSGTGRSTAEPSIRLSVSSLTFEQLAVGQTSQKTFTITNPGTATLSITGISASTEEYRVSPKDASVAPGQTLTVTVTFAPQSPGSKVTTLSIAHNAVGSPAKIALNGTASGTTPPQETPSAAQEGPGTITTLTGTGTAAFSGDGGPARQADLNYPTGIAVDAKGNIYIADSGNNRVRRVDPNGAITTFAGTGADGFSGDNGPATQARLSYPKRVVVDAKGVVFILDYNNNRVRRVGTDGVITTFAGRGTAGFSGDNGPATQASFRSPNGIALDPKTGALYIADTNNNRVRRVDASGVITTFAGTGTAGSAGDGGKAVQASLSGPMDVAVDTSGAVYIADQGSFRVRRVGPPEGIITKVAGRGSRGFSGDGGLAVDAQIDPWGLTVDAKGVLYIADNSNNRVRRVGTDGIITTLAGNGTAGFSGDGGPAEQASLNYPKGVTTGPDGVLYIADESNNRVRRVIPREVISPAIRLSVSSLTFEETAVGATSQKTFTISNPGTGSLSVTRIAVGGVDTTQFAVSPDTATVAAGGSRTITVTFSPASVGAKSATLTIYHNVAGSPLGFVSMSGAGVVAPNAQTGSAVLDLDTTPGDQGVRTKAGVKPAQWIDLEIVALEKVLGAVGFSARIAYDTLAVFYVSGSFKAGTMFTGSFLPLVNAKSGFVEVGGSSLTGGGSAVDKGTLGTVQFGTTDGFTGETLIRLTNVTFNRGGGNTEKLDLTASVKLSAAGGKPTPDFDGDGEVGFSDFFLFAAAFGQKATGNNAKFDLDADGEVAFGDFFLFAADFGKKL